MTHDGAFWSGRRSRRVHDDAWIFRSDFDRRESVALFKKRLERNETFRFFNGDDWKIRPLFRSGEGFFIRFILND